MPTHPTAAILAIGDELILGQTLDTNTKSIADALTNHGVIIREHATVPDDLDQLTDAITRLAKTSNLLITTGGLGPTEDDLTRQALANTLNQSLIEDPKALVQIRTWFTSRNRDMPEANRVQALRPPQARMLTNDCGTAPGLAATLQNCKIFCLPGPPAEMQPMFDREVLLALATEDAPPVTTRILYTAGLGESYIAGKLAELMHRENPVLIGTTASLGLVAIRIRTHLDAESARTQIDQAEQQIRTRLGPAIFSNKHNLQAHIIERLTDRNQTLGTCESCTAGLVAKLITDPPGSSAAFNGSLITYTNELKQKLARVPKTIIDQHGAVSGQCAKAMAEGAREQLQTDHCLAITGIAGPTGGSNNKPVGTVWIARASKDAATDTRHFLFKGSREIIRQWSATTALTLLRLHLDKVTMPLPCQQ
jgi:competence/damage-inducible protein CinA-like protein